MAELSELNDYDWVQVFAYSGDEGEGSASISPAIGTPATCEPVLRRNVKRIVALSEGENDGPNWLIVVELQDGRFAFLDAGCDYTGWDCRAGGSCVVSHSLTHLVRFGLTDEARDRLKLPNEVER